MTPLDAIIIAFLALIVLTILYVAQYIIKTTFKISKIALLGTSVVFFALAIFTLAVNVHHDGGGSLGKSHIMSFIKSKPIHQIISIVEYYVVGKAKEFFSWFMGQVKDISEISPDNSTSIY